MNICLYMCCIDFFKIEKIKLLANYSNVFNNLISNFTAIDGK